MKAGDKVRIKRRVYNWHGNDAVGVVESIENRSKGTPGFSREGNWAQGPNKANTKFVFVAA